MPGGALNSEDEGTDVPLSSVGATALFAKFSEMVGLWRDEVLKNRQDNSVTDSTNSNLDNSANNSTSSVLKGWPTLEIPHLTQRDERIMRQVGYLLRSQISCLSPIPFLVFYVFAKIFRPCGRDSKISSSFRMMTMRSGF